MCATAGGAKAINVVRWLVTEPAMQVSRRVREFAQVITVVNNEASDDQQQRLLPS